MQILVLQGPNLNLLGSREPDVYGRHTLADVQQALDGVAKDLGVRLHHLQSNHEGVLIDAIHQAAKDGVAGVVFNPGGYTHTSVALRDALIGTRLPFVEIHLSNIHAREDFRKTSLLADVALGVISGLGAPGYGWALRGLVAHLRQQGQPA